MGRIDFSKHQKSNWEPYRFEQIAFSISERVEPKETDLEIYVGLEHIDAESLHIKRWGTPADVEGTKLKVYKGDVIFGKRRAYQRKAAIAHFDGICSAHAMVLRANPEVIDPKLFPFFMHSDAFMHRAVDISVGSLSPTINWGTLKHQEFLLPPKEEQARLAELLWAADGVTANTHILHKKVTELRQQLVNDFYAKHSHTQKSIKSINCYKSKTVQPNNFTEEFLHYSLPAFDTNEMPVRQNGTEIQSTKLLITQDCVLFAKLNPRLPKIWYVELLPDIRQVASTEWLPIATAAQKDNTYLRIILSASQFTTKAASMAQGTSTSHKRIEPQKFYALSIPFPSAAERNAFVDNIVNLENTVVKAENDWKLSGTIKTQLINQIFS